jgi:hypothetical protein
VNTNYIPILSLVVAALAVFIGPLVSWRISWRIARRQIEASRRVAIQQMLGPMRQAWINSLRQKMAEFLSSTLHYAVAGYENRTDAEYQRMALLEQEIVLTINPAEPEHQDLVRAIRRVVDSLSRGAKMPDPEFIEAHQAATRQAQGILKREWNRVREGA